MVDRGGATQRLAGALAGVALTLTIGACSPSASPSGVAGSPIGSASASSTPETPSAGTWTTAGTMIEARYGHTATLLLDGRVLVAGGSGDATTASAELYDPDTETWTATAAMHEARLAHTATLLDNGKVLVVGGSGRSNLLATAELYDPDTETWTATGSLSEPRYHQTATLLLDGTVLVAGGAVGGEEGGAGQLASAEVYDPATGAWTVTGSMTVGRYLHSATLLADGQVLVAGDSDMGSAELYDPRGGSWTVTATLGEVRAEHTATLLPDGKVLVVGGAGANGLLASAELYDPDSATWTSIANMDGARRYHVATLLLDGMVLISGGSSRDDGDLGPLVSAELYDPGTGAWSTTGSITEARFLHAATRLADGRVLVVGGGVSGAALDSAELYHPVPTQ